MLVEQQFNICIIYVKNQIYRPHLAKTINLRQFRMEIDRKNGAVLTIILPGRFEICINSKNNVIFSEPFFSKMFSFKYISLIAAAAAAAAAAKKIKIINK